EESGILTAEPRAALVQGERALDLDDEVLAAELRTRVVDPGHLDAVLVDEILAEDLEARTGILNGERVRKIDLHLGVLVYHKCRARAVNAKHCRRAFRLPGRAAGHL